MLLPGSRAPEAGLITAFILTRRGKSATDSPDDCKATAMGGDLGVSRTGPRPGGGTPRVTPPNNRAFMSSLAPTQGPDARLGPVIRAPLTEPSAGSGSSGRKLMLRRWPRWKQLFLPWRVGRQVSGGFEQVPERPPPGPARTSANRDSHKGAGQPQVAEGHPGSLPPNTPRSPPQEEAPTGSPHPSPAPLSWYSLGSLP